MNYKDLQSNMNALERLYGLLEIDGGNGMPKLDDHARYLLKNMLDLTRQLVLKAHAQEIDGQVEALPLISHTPTPQDAAIVTATPERYHKKRCKDCQKTYVKPVAFNRSCDYSRIEMRKEPPLSDLRSFSGISSEEENESHYGSCTSKEASETIKAFEACYAALGSRLSNETSKSVEEHNMHTHEVNADQQKVKRIIEKIDSGKWRMNPNNFVPSEIQKQDKNRTSKKSKGHVMFQPPSKHSPQVIANENVDFVKMHQSNGKGTKLGKSLRGHESEETASSISYSSYRSSDQNRSYGSDCEDYISDTNSEEYFSLSSDQSQPDTSTSISEENVYSYSDSDEYHEPTPKFSSNSKDYSPYKHPMIPPRLKEIRSRNRKPAKETNHKKQSGIWNKMKDGLAVVYHLHHHNHKGKPFISKREAKACGEKAFEKLKKYHGKKKQNKFHGIMEAVLSHVHRPKKKKMEKTVAPLSKAQRGNKVVKKSEKELWKLGARKMKHRLRALKR